MRESNTFEGSATKNLQKRNLLVTTKGQCMKELNTLTDMEYFINLP